MPSIPNESKKLGAEFLKKWVLTDIPSLGPDWQKTYSQEVDEESILVASQEFFSNLFDCKITVVNADNARSIMVAKGNQSSPLKPAIFVS